MKEIKLGKKVAKDYTYHLFKLGKMITDRIAKKTKSINVEFDTTKAIIRQVKKETKLSYRFEKNKDSQILIIIPNEFVNNFLDKEFLLAIQDGFLEIKENKYLGKIKESMQLDKKSPGVTKEKKSKLTAAGEVIFSVEKSLTVEEKIKAENKKPSLKDGLVFNKQQLLALAELQAYTLENTLPCFEILVNIPNYLNEKVFNEKELKALKSIVFYMAKNTFSNTDIHLVAQEIRDFLLANGQSEVQVILSFNKSNDSEVA